MALQGPCSCPWNDGDRRPPSDDRRGVCVSCLTWCRCVVSIIAVRLCYMRVELLFCCRTQNRSLFFPLFFLRWKPALGRKQAVTSTSSPPSPYPLPTLSLPLPTLSPPFPYPLPTHSLPLPYPLPAPTPSHHALDEWCVRGPVAPPAVAGRPTPTPAPAPPPTALSRAESPFDDPRKVDFSNVGRARSDVANVDAIRVLGRRGPSALPDAVRPVAAASAAAFALAAATASSDGASSSSSAASPNGPSPRLHRPARGEGGGRRG